MFIKSCFLVSKLPFFFCGTLYFPYAASSSGRPSLYPINLDTFSPFPWYLGETSYLALH